MTLCNACRKKLTNCKKKNKNNNNKSQYIYTQKEETKSCCKNADCNSNQN